MITEEKREELRKKRIFNKSTKRLEKKQLLDDYRSFVDGVTSNLFKSMPKIHSKCSKSSFC